MRIEKMRLALITTLRWLVRPQMAVVLIYLRTDWRNVGRYWAARSSCRQGPGRTFNPGKNSLPRNCFLAADRRGREAEMQPPIKIVMAATLVHGLAAL